MFRRTATKSTIALGVDIKTSDQLTIIHLLGANDLQVVRQAIDNLHAFCIRDNRILNTICEMGVWKYLNALIECKDMFVVELTLDLIFQVMTVTSYPLILLDESRNVFTKFSNIFLNNLDDTILSKCILLMLHLLTIYPDIMENVFDPLLINRALYLIKNKLNDDIKILCMQFVKAFMTNKEQTATLTNLPNFQPNALVCFIRDGTEEIQNNSIKLLIKICSYEESNLLDLLCSFNTPGLLVRMLIDEKYTPIWFDVLYICYLILNSFTNCSKFVDTQEFSMLLSFIKICTPEFELRYAELLLQFAKHNDAQYRQKLHTYAMESVVLILMESTNSQVQQVVCQIMSHLSDHNYGLDLMVNDKSIEKLIDFLGDKNLASVTAAIDTVHSFMKRNDRMFLKFYDKYGLNAIINIFLNHSSILEEDIFEKILDILQIYLTHNILKEKVMSKEIFKKLVYIYNTSSESAALKASFIINDHFADDIYRNLFEELNGPKILIIKLETAKNELFKNTLILVKTVIIYKKLAKQLIINQLIPILLKCEREYACIDLILNCLYTFFLPLKFYNTNRLGITDVIKDNFYILTSKWEDNKFPIIEELEVQKINSNSTIYIVDYSYTKRMFEKMKSRVTPRVNLSITSLTMPDPKRPIVPAINYGGITEDPYLYDYFFELTQIFSKTNGNLSLNEKVKIIAKYVVKQLCGFDQGEKEPKHIFKVHLAHLKNRLGANFIPIGFLRMGFSCERALLFKVLADYFDILSAFQTDKKLYWNEVAFVCKREVKDHRVVNDYLVFSVVDLFDDIGALYPLQQREALNYFSRLEKHKCI